MQWILILGATSAIAQHTARRFAADGFALYLVGRNRTKLDSLASDLRQHGPGKIHTAYADLDNDAIHSGLIENAIRTLGGLDIVLFAHGILGDQNACEQSFQEARRSR